MMFQGKLNPAAWQRSLLVNNGKVWQEPRKQETNIMTRVLFVLAMLMILSAADVVAGPPQNNPSMVIVYNFQLRLETQEVRSILQITLDDDMNPF
jgi:hypothetical protein